MSNEMVTIIVPTYRSAQTIEQTLDSIRQQTYPCIELLVTDDCSPDNTVEVVQTWLERYGHELYRAQLLTAQENVGLPGNVDKALWKATGTYAKIIAGDDYMVPEAIAHYMEFCAQNPKRLPIAQVHLFSEKDENASFPDVQAYCERCYEMVKKDYTEQFHSLLKQNWIVTPSASFYPVCALRDAGGYDASYRWFEDYPMNLKLMRAGYSFGYIPEELVWYRMSEGSITASSQNRLKKAELAFFRKERFWYMVHAGMGWEAIKQCKAWLKVAMNRE